MSAAAADRAERPISFAAPFRHSAFTVTWTATLLYALIVGLGWATPANLLVFTLLIGAAGAMTVPA
jgi:hypothetical protein